MVVLHVPVLGCACSLPLIYSKYEKNFTLDLIPDNVVGKILLGSVVTETELGGLTTVYIILLLISYGI